MQMEDVLLLYRRGWTIESTEKGQLFFVLSLVPLKP